tara:strand:- start:708 stop:1697 length:990 start_codon:yes stop_codon:yes gene_type:complete
VITRENFFHRYWAALDDEGWKGIVLHSWKDLPEKIESDVDYAVAGCSPRELLVFLEQFSREHGWRLVQVIEHEPSAFFCVCMQNGGEFEQIALDVTWDYRRRGHFLVSSETLQKEAREVGGKSFKVTSPGAEAAYILAKAAAKNKGYHEIESRLKELCHEDSSNFAESLKQAFGFQPKIEESEAGLLGELKEWYPDAAAFKPVRSGKRYGLSEIQLYLRRCRQPTGLWLGFSTGDSPSGEEVIEDALRPIKPLYRRNKVTPRLKSSGAVKALNLMIRTSLVVETKAGKNLLACKLRAMIDVEASKDSGEVTRSILDHLNKRIVRRIAKL